MRVRQTARNNMVWRKRNFRKIHLKTEPSGLVLWPKDKKGPNLAQAFSIRPMISVGFRSALPKGPQQAEPTIKKRENGVLALVS